MMIGSILGLMVIQVIPAYASQLELESQLVSSREERRDIVGGNIVTCGKAIGLGDTLVFLVFGYSDLEGGSMGCPLIVETLSDN